MNKNIFWNKLKDIFNIAENREIGIIGTALGYIDKDGNGVEVDYHDFGLDFGNMLDLLKELEKDNLIELIDTKNMGYFIIEK